MAQKLGIGPFALQRSNISAVRLATLLLQDDDPKELERREAERLQREVEKAQRDEQKRVSFMEKQKLLSQVEKPMLRMLERLEIKDELALPLARNGVLTLKALRICKYDRLVPTLTNELGKEPSMAGRSEGWLLDALAKAVDMARRELANAAIHEVMLPDDSVLQRRAREEALVAKANAEEARDHTMAKKVPEEMDILRLRDQNGVLRKALLEVTGCWQDFLAFQPTYATHLATAETGPTWKDTVSWALWMMTMPLRQAGPVGASATEMGFMSRGAIERHLRLAREYVFYALYPTMRTIRAGEWRIYWVRVSTNFAAFYSQKGRQRWVDMAAAAAKGTAIRQGKSVEAQRASELEAVRKVTSMFRSQGTAQSRRRSPKPALPATLRSTPRASPVRRSPSAPMVRDPSIPRSSMNSPGGRAAKPLRPSSARSRTLNV